MNAIDMDNQFSIVKHPNNWSIKKLRCYESIKKFYLLKF